MFKIDELEAALHMPGRVAALKQFIALGDAANVAYGQITRIIQVILPNSLILISLIATDKLLVKQHAGLHLPWNIADQLPLDWSYCPYLPVVEEDKTQLRQFMMNIVINASEAIGDSNGSITITTGVVRPVSFRLTK